jgi:DNA repair ATPase RecN
MTMPAEKLKEKLSAVHTELQSVNRLDPELQTILETLNRDIRNLLEKNTRTAQTEALAEKLREYAARFAAQHPTVDATLRDVADVLGRMGI